MAEKKEKAAKPEKGKKPQGTKKGGLPLVALILGGITAVILLPVTLVLCVGVLPSIVAFLTDRSPKRSLTVSMGTLNLASSAVVVMQLIKNGLSFDAAVALLSQPLNWLIMWAGAFVGWALITFIPPTVAHVLAGMAELRIQKLKRNLDEIKKNWSEDVGQ